MQNKANTEVRLKDVVRKLKNKTKEAARAKVSLQKERELKRHLLDAAHKQKARGDVKTAAAVRKALRDVSGKENVAVLKAGGVVMPVAREMIRELSALNVAGTSVNAVIHTVGNWLGYKVEDAVSERTVGRIILEGGVAAKLQIVHEISSTEGFTVSGDGTTIAHLNYEAKHITLPAAPGSRDAPTTRFMGITSGVNHQSETQLQSWKDITEDYYDTYNRAFKVDGKHEDPLTFATKMPGLLSDHSADQHKLSTLLQGWKLLCSRLWKGKEVMRCSPVESWIKVLWEEKIHQITKAGGCEAWEELSGEKQDELEREGIFKRLQRLGEAQWAQLSMEEQREGELWIWAGCCMHKEMNATKGGAMGLQSLWTSASLTPPIKLLNRDNAATVTHSPSSDAAIQALQNAEGGAIKLTALAGAIFHHKDNKKGLQDTHRIYFEERLGYSVHFPDTSNTRFQSHLEASAELLVHLPLYIDLLLQVKDGKDKGNFNHMEYNVFQGLQDVPTLTEMATLTLYLLAVSHPYMRTVRRPGDASINAVELGELHTRVKRHCEAVIHNPGLLLDPEASYTSGSLDGQLWERPEAFWTVHRMAPTLPHLRECLIAFFQGVLTTWTRFTTEFAADSPIALLTEAKKKAVFLHATNDHNEGALGSLRVSKRIAPNQTLVTNSHQQFLHAEARRLDALRIDTTRRKQQAEYDRERARTQRDKRAATQAKREQCALAIAAIIPELDLQRLEKGLDTNGKLIRRADILAQLEWHRQWDSESLMPKKSVFQKMNRMDQLTQLIVAVTRYQRSQQPSQVIGSSLAGVCGGVGGSVPLRVDWDEREDDVDEDLVE